MTKKNRRGSFYDVHAIYGSISTKTKTLLFLLKIVRWLRFSYKEYLYTLKGYTFGLIEWVESNKKTKVWKS